MRLIAAVAVFTILAAACSGSSEVVAESTRTSVDPSTTAVAPTTTLADTPDVTVPTTVEGPPSIAVEVVGEEEVVFDYSETNCDLQARPDLPARAYRTGDQVSVLLSHTTTHRLTGPDFETLTLDCSPVFQSAFDHDPAAHAHHEWMAAVYTLDGETVHGVVHNEYHGYEADLADSRRALLNPDQDTSDWKYFDRDRNGNTTPMTPAEGGFSNGGLCSVGFWGAHPDAGCDAVSRWTSDRAGQIGLDVESKKVGLGGDGVLVDVRVDGIAVWTAELTDDAATSDAQLMLDVAVGSTIDIGVSANANASFDATEVRSFIYEELRCTSDDTWPCQLVELTAVRSDDGGATFSATNEPRDLVVSPSGRYEHNAGFAATWQPTNIVAHPDGSHVMLVQFDDTRLDHVSYSCLLRTENLADPTAWRAWDGEGFNLAAVDAYTSSESATGCAKVAPAPISGLVWNPEHEIFIAVGGFTQFGVNGHYLLASRDLLSWSHPVLIAPAEFTYSADNPPFKPYATLIDHDSSAASFDTIGSTPYLYFTLMNDPMALDFDLIRVQLSITSNR